MTSKYFPRRNQVNMWTNHENVLRETHGYIEGLGAHPKLTDAGSFMLDAFEALADWEDAGRPGYYENPNIIRQRTDDDCTVCAVAMLAGLSYEIVLAAAENTGYVPGSGTGARISEVLEDLEINYGFKRGQIIRYPSIVSVNSINQPGYHAVVVTETEVLDPSNKLLVTREHCLRTVSFAYSLKI